MAETKEEIAAERDRLRADNDRLREQLAAATTPGPAAPAHRFQLSEGDRSALEAHGWANIGGKRVTAEQVRELLAETDDQQHVVIGDQA
jgi:hypothetical protein